VIERAAELPKNYVDPEVIKAFGAVPSPYFRYYFHPNRVLAATEGHIVRARELMELSERMLADYRKWAPGKPPATLYERGAVWYSKIVAPTLLALAEKRTTELVLSVDNNGLFSWLPEDAIIEVPVPIVAGQMMTPRKADLPADIRALIMRNCVYEMQATEAIVNDNRPLALRALMSNLMVSRYEQAKGVLDLLWPVESIT
jgi:6-phospho-beta-glucosidase